MPKLFNFYFIDREKPLKHEFLNVSFELYQIRKKPLHYIFMDLDNLLAKTLKQLICILNSKSNSFSK